MSAATLKAEATIRETKCLLAKRRQRPRRNPDATSSPDGEWWTSREWAMGRKRRPRLGLLVSVAKEFGTAALPVAARLLAFHASLAGVARADPPVIRCGWEELGRLGPIEFLRNTASTGALCVSDILQLDADADRRSTPKSGGPDVEWAIANIHVDTNQIVDSSAETERFRVLFALGLAALLNEHEATHEESTAADSMANPRHLMSAEAFCRLRSVREAIRYRLRFNKVRRRRRYGRMPKPKRGKAGKKRAAQQQKLRRKVPRVSLRLGDLPVSCQRLAIVERFISKRTCCKSDALPATALPLAVPTPRDLVVQLLLPAAEYRGLIKMTTLALESYGRSRFCRAMAAAEYVGRMLGGSYAPHPLMSANVMSALVVLQAGTYQRQRIMSKYWRKSHRHNVQRRRVKRALKKMKLARAMLKRIAGGHAARERRRLEKERLAATEAAARVAMEAAMRRGAESATHRTVFRSSATLPPHMVDTSSSASSPARAVLSPARAVLLPPVDADPPRETRLRDPSPGSIGEAT